MNNALETAEAGIAKLQRAKSPAWSSPLRLVVLIALFAALGASAFAVVPDPAIAGGIAFAVGLVCGVGLWVFLRSLGRKVTLREGKAITRHLAEAEHAVQLLNEFATTEFAAEITRLREKHEREQHERTRQASRV
jgi:hypothetical protein